MEKKRISVQLDGRSYVVITTDDEAYVRSVAEEVSESILKASRSGNQLDIRDCAILAALDFCDDRNKAVKRNKDIVDKADQIIKQTADLNKQCREYKEKLTDAINENTALTKRIRALEDQLRILAGENEKLRKSDVRHADNEKKFEKTVQDKKTEKLMGYVPMRQYSLFEDNEKPTEKPVEKKSKSNKSKNKSKK